MLFSKKARAGKITNREQTARKIHNSGSNCSYAVFSAFSDIATGSAPAPRSEGGKCGAVLSAEKVLQQQGMEIEGFDAEFMEQYGSLKCGELRKARYSCNDLVGTAAKFVGEMIDK